MMINRRAVTLGLAAVAAAGAGATWYLTRSKARAMASPQTSPVALKPVVMGLDNPWGLAFLPDGTALVSERTGTLRRVDVTAAALSNPISGVPVVDSDGQGGLLGIALDPDFTTNRLVYMSFAEPGDEGNCTAVFRARLSDDAASLENGTVIFRQNRRAKSGHHFGSRLVFGRDGHLFVTTGERNVLRDQAQDPASHVGKVLRITRDGAPAPGNPELPGWAPEVWSIGHRNMQGAALHPDTGVLWTVEHGARGGDEVNTPQAGKNYGWPVISYGREYSMLQIGEGTAKAGMEQPLHYWDPSIAPSGMAFVMSDTYPGWKGSMLVGALAGQHISRLSWEGETVVAEEQLFLGDTRFRDVVEGPDGRIYVLTDASAPDGALMVITAT
ncbi:PQQ-dependent sugar dehydrogenase [Aestuariivirga sp.]|uniref:PQQ-dependent sugar dehydrogenase n=1 Tax=Aestuariivirga sp. TaxID=2650926 RepID=UPI0039E30CDB